MKIFDSFFNNLSRKKIIVNNQSFTNLDVNKIKKYSQIT